MAMALYSDVGGEVWDLEIGVVGAMGWILFGVGGMVKNLPFTGFDILGDVGTYESKLGNGGRRD